MKYLESFFWGFVASFGALLTEVIIALLFDVANIGFLPTHQKITIFINVIIEEYFKFLMISKRLSKFENVLSSSIAMGAGYGLFELGMAYQREGFNLFGKFGGISTLFIHIFTAAMISMPYDAKLRNKHLKVIGLVLAILFHYMYNYFALIF